MEWVENVNSDARVAYLLALTEKIIDQIENEEGYIQTRKTIDMCWDWVEEKIHGGDALYDMLENEDDTGVGIYIQFTDDPQQESIWFCVVYAIAYTIWQAYQYEKEEYVPQSIEMVDDSTIDDFMEKIKEVDGYQEEWAERLKQYLLENSPAGSDKKIKREEMIGLI
jgi:hypothetical protein